MAVILTIYPAAKWKKIGYLIDDFMFPDDFRAKARKVKPIKKTFRGYVEMANWLEKNKRFKNRVMLVRTTRELGLSRKVMFDGTFVWVEDYGNV